MPCYSPVRAYQTAHGIEFKARAGADILRELDLACGVCQGCRLQRAADWEVRIMHEARLHNTNSFLTLTYADHELPQYGSLCHRDVQLFLKRFRAKHGEARYYVCGEYGPETQRPHYHMALFGHDFRADRKPYKKTASGHLAYESDELHELWKKGQCTVQDLTPETAAYAAGYIMKKRLGKEAKYTALDPDTGELVEIAPEYAKMSLKPGIGTRFYQLYKQDLYNHDHAILRGKPRRVPRFYDRLLEEEDPDRISALKENRELRAFSTRDDNTPERLKAKEIVQRAKMRNKLRSFE